MAGRFDDRNNPNADETSALRIVKSGGYNFGVRYTRRPRAELAARRLRRPHRQRAGHRGGDRRGPHGSRARSTRRWPCSSTAASSGCRTTRPPAPRSPEADEPLRRARSPLRRRHGDQRLRRRTRRRRGIASSDRVRLRGFGTPTFRSATTPLNGKGIDRRARRSSRRTAGARRRISPSTSACATRRRRSTRRTTSRSAASRMPMRLCIVDLRVPNGRRASASTTTGRRGSACRGIRSGTASRRSTASGAGSTRRSRST